MSTVSVSVSEARASLPEILQRVSDGEEVTLTRHGVAVAVVVRPDTLRTRRARSVMDAAIRLGEHLDVASNAAIPSAPPMSAQRADDLVASLRRDRDRDR